MNHVVAIRIAATAAHRKQTILVYATLTRKNRIEFQPNLVLSVVLCTLARVRSEHALAYVQLAEKVRYGNGLHI
jgi:hypothetical protein